MRCAKCGNRQTEQVDGKSIGGFPGIKYHYCNGCGWSHAITRRVRRERLTVKKKEGNNG